MSFYSIFSSLNGFEAGLITVHKPFFYKARDLGCSNLSVTKPFESLEHLKLTTAY
jgi:hypothetical protein